MDDRELEARMRGRLHRRFDTGDASSALHRRVSESLRSEPAAPASVLVRFQPFLLAAAAIVILVAAAALVIGPRLGWIEVAGPSATPAASPSGAPAASASPAPASAALTPTAAASVPPRSTTLWTGLTVQPIVGAPVSVMTLTAWSGGYLAIGDAGSPDAVRGWTSADGVTWAPVPMGAFPPASRITAVGFGAGLYVAAEDSQGVVREVTSADGLTWSPPALVDLAVSPDSVASGPAGLVATTGRVGDGVRFKTAGVASVAAWQHVSLPDGATVTIEAVTATSSGFVAVGIDRPSAAAPGAHPVAYASPDGLTWTAARVPADPNDGFVSVVAGAHVVYAVSQTPDTVPGTSTLWSSQDGTTWTKVAAPPLGVIDHGAGIGSLIGSYVGDGTRVLGYVGGYQVMDLWLTLDGSAASRPGVYGDPADQAAALGPDSTPWLLRNGILFTTTDRTWVGLAQP
jgi:hypothetical protein